MPEPRSITYHADDADSGVVPVDSNTYVMGSADVSLFAIWTPDSAARIFCGMYSSFVIRTDGWIN